MIVGRGVASRRQFLLGAGAAATGLLLVGCGGDSPPTGGPTETTVDASSRLGADLRIAAAAAGIENLMAATYQAAIDSAGSPKVGFVSPAAMTLFQTARRHHEEHAAAWNAVLTSAGRTRVTGPDETMKLEIDRSFAQVNSAASLTRLLHGLENVAGATYLHGIAEIENNQVLKTASSIQPVEMQHSAVLNFLLGTYPTPDAYARTEGARPAPPG